MNDLAFRSPSLPKPRGDAAGPRPDDYIDLDYLWTLARRNARLVAAFVVVGLCVGFVYLRLAPPVYSAETHVLVDEKIGQVADSLSTVGNDMQMDTRMASEIEVLKSMRLALTVVDAMKLTANESFNNPPPSPVARLVSPLRGVVSALRGPRAPEDKSADPVAAAQKARDDAALRLRREIAVSRVERSSVIAISYESYDPVLAQGITEAYADAFLQEQKIANAAASSDATDWMRVRLAQLSDQQKQAALAVETFRSRNGLTVARGELVSEQRVSDLTAQLALAQSEFARTKAQSEQLAAIIASGTDNAVKSIALSNSEIPDTVVQQLRGRYLEISRRIAQITADYGAEHPQAVQLRREQANLSARLFQQLQDLAARYRNDFDVAQNRLQTLEDIMSKQTGENLQSGEAVVELRKLEQDAATVNTVYTNFLARYEEAVQKQNSPVTDLRIISNATLPQDPIGPRFTLTMLGFAVFSGLLGVATGVLREFGERSMRTGDDVQRYLGLPFIGYLPNLHGAGKKSSGAVKGWPFSIGVGPESVFAETLRNAVHALRNRDHDRSKVIGVVSALPGEGKTTFSAQLALLLASSGKRTLLIDADMRRPALSDALNARQEPGLAEALRGQAWRPLLRRQNGSGLSVLPAGGGKERAPGNVLFESSGMADLFKQLRDGFDYVIVDLPPIGPVTDAKLFEPYATDFIFAAHWGKTPRKLARTVLDDAPELAAKVAGVVLNATDFKALSRYGATGSRERAYRAYESYYNSSLT